MQAVGFSTTEPERHIPQEQMFKAFDGPARLFGFNAGTRGGKTYPIAVEICVEAAYSPDGKQVLRTIPIIAPYGQLTDRAFRIVLDAIVDKGCYKPFVPDLKPKDIKYSEHERRIELPWKSRIVGLTADNPDSMLGEGYPFILCDEFARFKDGVFETYVERASTDVGGKIILITTPQSRTNHWYRRFTDWSRRAATDPLYHTQHWTSYENPHIDHATLDRIKEEYIAGGMYDIFRREYLAEFVAMSGAIYPMFEPDRAGEPWHVASVEYDPDQPIYLGVDWGFDHPFVCLFGQIHDGDRMFVFHEIYSQRQSPLEQVDSVLDYLATLDGNPCPELAYCDPSGAGNKKLFRDAGIPTYEPPRRVKMKLNSVTDGITTVRKSMSRQDKPGLVIDNSCQYVIRDLEAYAWNERAQSEQPLKLQDDGCDALRYLLHGTLGLSTRSPLMFEIT